MIVQRTFSVLKPVEIGGQVAPIGAALTLSWPAGNQKARDDIEELVVGGYIAPGEDQDEVSAS
jgi:hypothetical protein